MSLWELVTDRRIFNCIIMTLYILAMVRWAAAGSWADVAYWFFAFGITFTVTFGYSR
jgi:hypothetical protein